MNKAYATIEDMDALFRTLTEKEAPRAEALLPIVSDSIRQEAFKVGKDIDRMLASGELLENVLKSVVVDVTARVLMTSTDTEPMTQMSQSGMGFSVSGTYLVPGGGLFIKRTELARLGLKRQRMGAIDIYGTDQRNDGCT